MRDTIRVDGNPNVVALPQTPNPVELQDLRAFIAVAEELSFSRAAQRLFITLPALSQQIYALECRVGCELFHRSTQRAKLTQAGESLLASARMALAGLDRDTGWGEGPATTRTVVKEPDFLDPGEHVTAMARMHPAVLIGPVAGTLAGAALAGMVSTYFVNDDRAVIGGIVAMIVWLLWLGIVLVLVTSILALPDSCIHVTDKRLILTARPPQRRYAYVRFDQITHWWLLEPSLGRIIGYQRLVLVSDGDDRAVRTISYVPATRSRFIVSALPPDARRDEDPSVFAHWAPRSPRRSFLVAGRALIVVVVITAAVLVVKKPYGMSWLVEAAAIVTQLGFGLLSLISPV